MRVIEENTPDDFAAQSRSVVRQPRGRLRRKVMLAMLLLVTLPGYTSLTIAALSAWNAVRVALGDQVAEKAQLLAGELDRVIAQRTQALTEIVDARRDGAALNAYLDRLVEEGSAVGEVALDASPRGRRRALNDAQIYLVSDAGRVMARLHDGTLTDAIPRPTPLDGTYVLSQVANLFPTEPFLAELPRVEGRELEVVLGAPLPAVPGRERRYVALVVLPLGPVFEQAERFNPEFGQRLVVVSQREGLLYTTQEDSDYSRLIMMQRERLFRADDSKDLQIVQLRSERYSIAHAEAQSIHRLSAASGMPPSQWAVVQTNPIENILSSLTRGLAVAVAASLVLTAFALLLAWWASGRLVGPIIRLTQGMQRFSRGDLDFRVEADTGDEIEELAVAANIMAENMSRTLNVLEERVLEVDEKARLLEVIHTISHSVNRVLDLDKLFERILRELLVQVPAERLALTMLDVEKQHLTLDFVHPMNRDTLPRGSVIPVEGSVTGRALKDQTVTIRRIVEGGPYVEDKVLSPLGMKALCVVPLIAPNGPVGTLNLATRKPDLFQVREVRILERIADSLALAVEHSKLYMRVASFAQELEQTVDLRTRELRSAQARLVATEKFAATGAIAAHIAHEVNNPLLIIKNYLKMTTGRFTRSEVKPEDIDSARDSLRVIEEEIDRIARIIEQLRQASKPTKPQIVDVELHGEVRKMVELFEGTLKKRSIGLEVDFDERIGVVPLCTDYLRQILINLARNAMDAMDEEKGGILTIRTRSKTAAGGMYAIDVQDTGCGIPPEKIASIFDPFFTTKPEGKGTGLGLSVSFGLAQTMGGTIEVESTVGAGTTMRILLPLVAPASTPPPEESSAPGEPPRPGESASTSPSESGIVRRRGQKIIIG